MARHRDKGLAIEIGRALSEAIRVNSLPVSRAARILGVSRQSLYQYLRGGALPGMDVLHRACIAWNIKIHYRGVQFGIGDFAQGITDRQRKGTQLEMPYILRSLHN